MRYGHFDDANREYIIERPDTPLPWINYLGNESYFGLISNTAGGYSFYKDARLRRITRYRYNNAPLDFGGRYLYLRDENDGSYWSPSWQPVQRELKDYSCRHGMGYTVIASTYSGIRAETRYFVPLGENLEVWQLTVTNQRAAEAKLSVFSAVEFCLWDALDDATNFQRNFSTGQIEVEDQVIYHKTEYRERRNHFAYFACSENSGGFDTQRESFLGPYRSWDRPRAVEQGTCSNSIANGWQPIASFDVRLSLQPGEQKQVIFILGYHENPKDQKFDPPDSQTIDKKTVKPIIERYLRQPNADSAFDALHLYWDELLHSFQVNTSNEHVDRMVNIWNAYQCMITFNLSRSASLYESGIGRGLGFRDSNQDLLGFVHMVPWRARERILDITSTQLPSGGAYHQYQPLTKRGNNEIGSNFSDDPHWLVIGVAAYLRETGDWSILEEKIPYDNQAQSEMPLYEHLQRSIQYTLDRLGPHGLPLIGRADWNDCLNLNCFSDVPGQSFQTTMNKDGKVAESVFVAGLFVESTRAMAALAEHYSSQGRKNDWSFQIHQPKYYHELADQMTQTIYQYGWDGEWFVRAYDDFGHKVGSKECEEGQIYIEPQGFCILAGVGLENGMAKKALDSVNAQLATPHGIMILQPAYSRYYLHLGEISSYPPGYKENAGIFCHNNPWVMIAEARTGSGDRAMDYYMQINPSVREELADLHRCEPYVYAQMIAGRDAPTHGEAKNSWLTGTAAWNYVAITQWILGIRPEYDGLRIDPCIPSAWNGFTAVRRFRGKTIRITVYNEQKVCRGVARMRMNGLEIQGSVIPFDLLGDDQLVEVWLGNP